MAYRKINPLLWDDEWFVELGDFDRTVWLAVLTGPQVRPIPGLMMATAATISDYLRRSPADVAAALARFAVTGRVEVDQRARMLRVVNAPRWAVEHGEPENPNVIKGWWKSWKELPDCETKRRHLAPLRDAFVMARDRSVAGERDATKVRPRLDLWNSTWAATFGTVPAPPVAPMDQVPGTIPEPFQNYSGTVSGTVPEPSQNRLETVPAYTRARSEQEQEQEPEQINPPYPPQAGEPVVVTSSAGDAPPSSPPRARAGRRKASAPGLPGVGTEAADDVFAAYLAAWKRVIGQGAPPVLDEKRRRLVRARVAEGHTVEHLKAAAAGIFDEEWHVRERRTGFGLAMQDAEHVERFASAFAAAETSRQPAVPPVWLNQKPPPPRFRLQRIEASLREDAALGHPFDGLDDATLLAPEVTS